MSAHGRLRLLTSAINADSSQMSHSFYRTCSLALRNLFTSFSTAMKLKQDQLERLATSILANYQAKGLITPKANEAELKAKVMAILSQNFAEEEAIEEEARKMLASYARVSKDMDPYRMFILAKQKLAAKRGFIL
jgi:hypothetical protein